MPRVPILESSVNARVGSIIEGVFCSLSTLTHSMMPILSLRESRFVQLKDVNRNYDRVASKFDLLTDSVFGWLLNVERFRAQTIDLLGDVAGKNVLDVGCGTGRNLPILTSRVGTRGRIVAVDYSTGMLSVAQQKANEAKWTNVEFKRDDAARLESIDMEFDAIVSVWCYGIVHDLPSALRRALELLRPGGRLAIMDFHRTKPNNKFLRSLSPIYGAALRLTGIDSADDLDDSKLQEKWQVGKKVLHESLTDISEDTYLDGGGFMLVGRKPMT